MLLVSSWTENKSVILFFFFTDVILLRSLFFSPLWIVIAQFFWICAWIAVPSVQWWRFELESLRTATNLLQFDPIPSSGDLGFDELGMNVLGVLEKRLRFWSFGRRKRNGECVCWVGVLWLMIVTVRAVKTGRALRAGPKARIKCRAWAENLEPESIQGFLARPEKARSLVGLARSGRGRPASPPKNTFFFCLCVYMKFSS